MTQEDKQLLFVDLCGRLPYGVNVKIGNNPYIVKGINKKVNDEADWVHCVCSYGISAVEIEFCKPYLFPMSSMTEEQKKEYHNLCSVGIDECGDIIYFDTYESIDYLNKNKFDYRYLIPKGLAIDCTHLNLY